jgi:putative DNA primase/helicase
LRHNQYCHNSGTRPVSLRRFVTLLSDLGKNQLGLEIKKERDRFGSYFVGLKIRDESDTSPPLITGNSEVVINTNPQPENTNVISKLWTMVMDKVTDIIDCVLKDTPADMMDESTDGDECDRCPKGYRSAYDGKNEKSPKIENKVEAKTKCNTQDKRQKEKAERLEEFSKMPSLPSPKKAQSQIEQSVMDSDREPSSKVQSAITVGDRVTIDDCLGHWNWASPFTVEAIDGEMVKLEMVSQRDLVGFQQRATDEPFRVSELVEMERLERVQ